MKIEKDEITEKFEIAAKESLETLIQFLRTENADEFQERKAATAKSVLASYSRHEATISARERTVIGLARSLAKDRDQLSEYIKITMPESPITQALPGPVKH